MIAPKPAARAGRVPLWRYLRLFRADILSAQPARLYRAWMAEFRTPFFRSYLCNDPALIARVLKETPQDFPKSPRVTEGLAPLLGGSVFVTGGEVWARQRRIIDPAFAGGRIGDSLAAMWAAGLAARARLLERAGQAVDIEAETGHAAADVIFRTLFSRPITDDDARRTHAAFRAHQRAQPLLNLAAFLPLPRWMPRLHRRRTRATAAEIRTLLGAMTDRRAAEIAAGTAPDDLATRIMTTPDPVDGTCLSAAEMADQVAIFYLAGHETSASALAWALWLLAANPAVQDGVAAEGQALDALAGGAAPAAADVAARLRLSRDVFRETLRLYPPVPMMVRQARCPVQFRGRAVPKGAQIVLSPWHLHRHERLWDNPDAFDPGRWQTETGRAQARDGYLPFSAGPRICPGAGFAMLEGPLLLAMILARLRVEVVADRIPRPVAHLTVRAADGIWLRLTPR